MFETIVALATPPLKSALAIIRVSGDDCFDIVNKCFSKDISNISERTALIGNIVDGDEQIDEVVLIVYKGPKSYTGEDMVEIICHGSNLIYSQIIDLLIKLGARMATNGEYTSRAFLNQKMDLIQSEAVNDIINATTKEAKNLSMLSLKGETSKLIYPIKDQLSYLLSLIEVNIDYPEYTTIEEANSEKVIQICSDLIKSIDKLISEGEKGQIIKDGIKTAIVGEPNVGKSTLLNALLGEDKAIVTDIAGTTRDVVEGDININGLTLHLLDTAGYRKSSDLIEEIGVKKTKETINDADLVIVVKEPGEQDNPDLQTLLKDKVVINVINKSDLLTENEKNSKDLIYISAKNNDISALTKEILRVYDIGEASYKTPSLNNARQLGLLKSVKTNLEKAVSDTKEGISIDLVSISLYSALQNVLDILGEDNKIDISKEIFSRFCVGK